MNPLNTLDLVLSAISLLIFFCLLTTAAYSLLEQEFKAAQRAFCGAFIFPLPFLVLLLFHFPARDILSWGMIGFLLVTFGVLMLPIPSPFPLLESKARFQLDERNTMFSRNELLANTQRFNEYYQDHPDHLSSDSLFREKPGLLSQSAMFHHPLLFAATDITFKVVEQLHQLVEPVPKNEPSPLNPDDLAHFIKGWLKKSGAHSVGITRLQSYHLYTFSGRRERYGQTVLCHHKTAIALTVEMDSQMIATGPQAPTVLESAEQYLNAGILAVKLAGFLAGLGYASRAHIDANYLVVCPLVARDAGLGEIGRMGILMTPKLGPRVRIAVVTTDLDLPSDPRNYNQTMPEFCRFCEKCAQVCPSQAIPKGEMEADINGIMRWQIDQDRCFSYWCQAGTDCGRCIALCPYSHRNNLMHNTVRWFIGHAYFFRRLAARFDDWLYGSRPAPASLNAWQNKGKEKK